MLVGHRSALHRCLFDFSFVGIGLYFPHIIRSRLVEFSKDSRADAWLIACTTRRLHCGSRGGLLPTAGLRAAALRVSRAACKLRVSRRLRWRILRGGGFTGPRPALLGADQRTRARAIPLVLPGRPDSVPLPRPVDACPLSALRSRSPASLRSISSYEFAGDRRQGGDPVTKHGLRQRTPDRARGSPREIGGPVRHQVPPPPQGAGPAPGEGPGCVQFA